VSRLVVREHVEDAARESVVRRGDVGIETPTSSFGWDTLAAFQFRSLFTVPAPGMPVYETNDPAE
jgi:hypothetical protein